MNKEIASRVAVEINEILDNFSLDVLEKIPQDFKEKMKNLASKTSYEFKCDKTKKLKEQSLMEETKNMLSYIYREYICSDEEKQKWKEYDRFRNKKMEELKKKKFESND